MKKIICGLLLLSSFTVAFSQNTGKVKDRADGKPKVKPCKKIQVNLTSGTVNGVKPTALMDVVKKKLPCYTGESEEGEVFNCGGGVFYLNDDIYFYTGRDYIEIREKFTGKTEPSLLGTYRDEVKSILGVPDKEIDGGRILIYKKAYGALRVVFNMDDKCVEIGIHAVAPADVKLCE